MAKDFLNTYPTFSLDPHHLYVFDGKNYRYVEHNTERVSFSLIEDPHQILTYDMGTLNRMNASGFVSVHPSGLMSNLALGKPVRSGEGLIIAGLSGKRLENLNARYAYVRALQERYTAGLVKLTEASITADMINIRELAAEFLIEEPADLETDLAIRNWREGKGRKPKTVAVKAALGERSARAILGWFRRHNAGGKAALIDTAHNQGNPYSYFTSEENALMAEVISKEYLSLERKTIKAVHADMKIAFDAKNEARVVEGLTRLRCPGYETVRKFIASLDEFKKLVARHGQKFAMKKMRAVSKGMEFARPLERVEMDEWKIDLLTILTQSGLLSFFEADVLQEMGLMDENGALLRTKRWWLVVAICCRTRCILGMILTANPKSSSAIACLRMAMSDKGQFADAAGALSPWPFYGTPETLAVDNGSAFKSVEFTSACTDSGITKIATIAGDPWMRGVIERVFFSLRLGLLTRLPGKTFKDAVDRGDYPAEERACLRIDELAMVIVRWVVDVYHNSPHAGLGGRTPMAQWEADMKDGNFPLLAAPNKRQRRVGLGLSLSRVMQKDGIRVLGVQYNSGDLAAYFRKRGNVPVEVRWSDEDIGAIEVKFGDAWDEVAAVSDLFRGMDAATWAKTRRALRARDPKRVDWDEHVMRETIKFVEALKSERMSAFGIVDHGWTQERLERVEAEAAGSINVVSPAPRAPDPADGIGQAILPVAPVPPVTETEIAVEKSTSVRPAATGWGLPDLDESEN